MLVYGLDDVRRRSKKYIIGLGIYRWTKDFPGARIEDT